MDGGAAQGRTFGAARYPVRASDLARFVDDPVDEVVATIVRAASGRSADAVASIRRDMTPDDAYLLVQFIRRRSIAALREANAEWAHDAIWAVRLLPGARLDPRDIDLDLPLLAARRCGLDLDEMLQGIAEDVDPVIRAALEAAVSRSGAMTLRDCMLVEVSTQRYGVGYVEDWAGAASPPVNLAARCIALADGIEAEGTYRVRDLRITDLPGVWFSEDAVEIRSEGCISLSADHEGSSQPYSHGLLVFVATVGRRRAKKLARSAERASVADRPRRAWVVGDTVAVLIGGSATVGEGALESTASLGRFERVVNESIGG